MPQSDPPDQVEHPCPDHFMKRYVNLCGININLKQVRAVTFCDPEKSDPSLSEEIKKRFGETMHGGATLLLIVFQDGSNWKFVDFDLSLYDFLCGALQGNKKYPSEYSFAEDEALIDERDAFIRDLFVKTQLIC